MTVSFGSSLPSILNRGDRITAYFDIDSLPHPSVGYFEVFRRGPEWVLHSIGDGSYRGLKRENGEWKCLRSSSLHDTDLIGYSLWNIRDFEIHGFFREQEGTEFFFGGFDNHGFVMNLEGRSRFLVELPEGGSVEFETFDTNAVSYEISGNVSQVSVEVYEGFTTDYDWFKRVNGGASSDFVRLGMNFEPEVTRQSSSCILIEK